MIYEEEVVRAAKDWFGGLETNGNDGSETCSDDELEQTQVEGLVGVNDEDDDIFDTGEAAEGSGSVMRGWTKRRRTGGSSRPWTRL